MAIPLIAAAALANIGGGILGNMFSQGDSAASADEMRKILELYQNIQLPDVEKMKLDLAKYQSAGEIDPKMAEAIQLGAVDPMQNIQLDPRLRQARMNALQQLTQIGGTGFTPDELNAAISMNQQNEADLTSRLQQLTQQQEARGLGSSNMALAQRMMEAQSSANRGAENARNLQSEAFKRSLQAITSGGELAGNIESGDYARGADLAQALNRREFANVDARNRAEQSNVDRFNRALEYNLGNQQDIMNKNVGVSNQQQTYNKGLAQQQFDNEMRRAEGIAGGRKGMSGVYGDRADATRQMWGGIGGGLGKSIMGMSGGSSKTGLLDFDRNKYDSALDGTDSVLNAARRRK